MSLTDKLRQSFKDNLLNSISVPPQYNIFNDDTMSSTVKHTATKQQSKATSNHNTTKKFKLPNFPHSTKTKKKFKLSPMLIATLGIKAVDLALNTEWGNELVQRALSHILLDDDE